MLQNMLLLISMAVGLMLIASFLLGQYWNKATIYKLENTLLQSVKISPVKKVDFASFSLLPEPVARYFRYALTDGQPIVTVMKIRQTGMLRTNTITDKWMRFTANQLVVPSARGFIWNAKIATPLKTHINVLDAYIAGVGSGRVSLLSAIVIGSETGGQELNSGALYRYLAEAVWYPTALLPESGVVWTAINGQTALATLKDGATSVSLEFCFNAQGEVTGIYSPERFRSVGNEYKKMPWEGHFRNYITQAGMKVPSYGEVGWYESGVWQVVWKGSVVDAQYGD